MKRGLWMGRPIEEMSREELMDALEHMGTLYSRAVQEHLSDLDEIREFAALRP